jgi:TetR/AcrR family transcriptional repressor of nem operon
MARDGQATRTRILDATQALVLEHGFAATSIDQILAAVGITKGAFFHHFASKEALADALMERFAATDEAMLNETFAKAERLSDDPLQQLLLVVGLIEEAFRGLSDPLPGCLIASYCYENDLMTARSRAAIRASLVGWRKALAAKLRRAVELHRPERAVDLDELADMLNVIVEGAYVMSRALEQPSLIAEQLRHYRNYLELLFSVEKPTAKRRR